MSGEFHDLVRAMELACYRINPPHQPAIAPLSLQDLGADILADQLQKPEWQYAYLRGIAEKSKNTKQGKLTPWTVQAGHTGFVSALTTLADGRLVSGSEDKSLRVRTEASGQWHSVELTGHTGTVYALTTLADGRLVSGSGDNSLRVWTEASGQWHSEILALTANIGGLIGKGGLLMSAGASIMIWRLPPTGAAQKMTRLFVADGAFSVTEFFPDGTIQRVRITPTDPERLWQTTVDLNDGKPLPCDPLLHRYAAFFDEKGRHFDVWDCPDQFDWEGLTENGARTLVLYGEPQTKL